MGRNMEEINMRVSGSEMDIRKQSKSVKKLI